MREIFIKTILVFVGLVLASCEAEDLNKNNAEYNSRMLSAFIYDSDLVGKWEITGMIAENPVDLDKDGVSNTNLLSETSCFDPVYITFKGDKTFYAVKYRMEVKQGEDGVEYICMGKTTESGNWTLKNSTLTFYSTGYGSIQKYEREIILKEETFVHEVNSNESEDYVENNSSSEIAVVALEYSRVEK